MDCAGGLIGWVSLERGLSEETWLLASHPVCQWMIGYARLVRSCPSPFPCPSSSLW